MCQRLAKHVSDWRLFKLKKDYVRRITSFSILDQGNYYIELVEIVNCSSKEELHIRERFWLKNNPCVNLLKNLMRTPEDNKEYHDVWNLSNRDAIRGHKKAYAEKNITKIRANRGECLLCDCGRYYTRANRAVHIKSIFHKENINRVMFSQFLDL